MKIIETLVNNEKFLLKIDSELNYSNEEIALYKNFINFCITNLKINGKFIVKLITNREKHGVKTTAYYNDSKKSVVVYSKNRMIGDIMRSIAHELTHKKQYEENRIKDTVTDGADGSPIENEANAKAGEIIRKFINTVDGGNKIFN